ncbi:hypothetical protein JDM601_2772 [Mycolicibacter sinensis]|uniref:Uncharacterized protein n=1 Tax=Mycolicibacter sinensis (strain JDM601) TaxID=875328 RepID=F5YZA8_MYCSD|nr:hypothetical protein JDM601_2772 [Mycolicibacter sinensis]
MIGGRDHLVQQAALGAQPRRERPTGLEFCARGCFCGQDSSKHGHPGDLGRILTPSVTPPV